MAEELPFSKSVLTRLPTMPKRVYYRDKSTRGLLVASQPSGAKTFELYRKVAGRPVRIALGRFNPTLPDSREFERGTDPLSLLGNAAELNLKQARLLARAVNAQLDKGINPVTIKRHARQNTKEELTLGLAFSRYVEHWLVPHEKRSTSALEYLFQRHLGKIPTDAKKKHGRQREKSPSGVDWDNRKLSSISTDDIRHLMIATKDGGSPHTANRVFELLRAIYAKSLEWKLYEGENPCEGIPMFREESRERFLTAEELPKFFSQMNKEPDGDFKDFVLLSLLNGARRENTLGMRWQDLQLNSGLWIVPGVQSKSGSALTIPLTRGAIDILQKRKSVHDGSTFVFPAHSAKGYLTPPKRKWAAFVKAAGLSGLRLHDLRRTMGSWAAMTGASLPIIGKALGHRSGEATAVYARLQSDPVRAAMETAVAAMLVKAGIPDAIGGIRKPQREHR